MKNIFKKILLLNKKEGETPLEALENFRKKNKKHKEYKDVKMTYAGRLDPMASGLLLMLAGEEIKNKEKYLNLEKEYVFEILFGFATDTYDILGKVVRSCLTNSASLGLDELTKKEITKHLKSFLGESIQKYPMYSSKTVKGKPLFAYARENEEVCVPERKIFIKKLKLEKIRETKGGEYFRIIDNKKLFKNIEKRIRKVKGDFRQDEILEIWRKNLNVKHRVLNKYFIVSLKIKCSSGTYVRGIANTLGNKLKIPALAYSIKRTKIGKYVI